MSAGIKEERGWIEQLHGNKHMVRGSEQNSSTATGSWLAEGLTCEGLFLEGGFLEKQRSSLNICYQQKFAGEVLYILIWIVTGPCNDTKK